MSKHTPGPWDALGCDVKPFEKKYLSLGDSVCLTFIYPSKRSIEECEANARLIAAAPEMLELCKQALKEIDENKTFDTTERLRAVIKKAEGE